MSKKLYLGLMKSKEIAEWFGIKPGSYNNVRAKKLEELKRYATFDVIRGGVVIKEILDDEYSKEGSSNYGEIKKSVDKVWNKDGLDSCKRVSLEVEEKLQLPLATDTVYKYTRESRDELYGKPFEGAGSKGYCEYVWCKKNGDGVDAKFSLLTAEEEAEKQRLIKKYFGDASEKQIIVKGMVKTGEIKEEDAWGVLEELTNMHDGNFMCFLRELQEKVGCQIIRGTKVTRIEAE